MDRKNQLPPSKGTQIDEDQVSSPKEKLYWEYFEMFRRASLYPTRDANLPDSASLSTLPPEACPSNGVAQTYPETYEHNLRSYPITTTEASPCSIPFSKAPPTDYDETSSYYSESSHCSCCSYAISESALYPTPLSEASSCSIPSLTPSPTDYNKSLSCYSESSNSSCSSSALSESAFSPPSPSVDDMYKAETSRYYPENNEDSNLLDFTRIRRR